MTTTSDMLSQLSEVAQTLPGSAQSAVSDLTTLLTLPPPVVSSPPTVIDRTQPLSTGDAELG